MMSLLMDGDMLWQWLTPEQLVEFGTGCKRAHIYAHNSTYYTCELWFADGQHHRVILPKQLYMAARFGDSRYLPA